jgi:hypothetical protein
MFGTNATVYSTPRTGGYGDCGCMTSQWGSGRDCKRAPGATIGWYSNRYSNVCGRGGMRLYREGKTVANVNQAFTGEALWNRRPDKECSQLVILPPIICMVLRVGNLFSFLTNWQESFRGLSRQRQWLWMLLLCRNYYLGSFHASSHRFSPNKPSPSLVQRSSLRISILEHVFENNGEATTRMLVANRDSNSVTASLAVLEGLS